MTIERPAGPADGPDPRRASGPSDHATHDELLITRLVAADVSPAEADEARLLVDSCPSCRLLAGDLVAIATAIAEVPPARRTRDFRLSPEKAASLSPSRLARVLARLGPVHGGERRSWLTAVQPAAGALVAIGLVMALVTSPVGLLASGGASTSAPRDLAESGQAAGTAAPAMVAAPAMPSAAGVGATGAEAAPPAPATAPAPAYLAVPAASGAPAPLAVAAQPAPSPAAHGGTPAARGEAPGRNGGPTPAAPVPLVGAGSCGTSGAAGGGGGCPGPSSAALVRIAPGPSEASVKSTGGASGAPFSPETGTAPIQAWEAWLVLAVAAAIMFIAARILLRRAS